jgi:hypothetical protein
MSFGRFTRLPESRFVRKRLRLASGSGADLDHFRAIEGSGTEYF